MEIDSKLVYAVISTLILLAGYIPYIITIHKGKTKPHFYSYFSWSLTITIILFAQLASNSGYGVMPLVVSSTGCIYITYLAYIKRAELTYTFSDRICLTLSLIALPIWYVTAYPLYAVLILTVNYGLSYIPTFRKTYIEPDNEDLTPHILGIITFLLSIFAIEEYNLATMVYPVSLIIMLCSFIGMVLFRKYQLGKLNFA